MKFIKIAQKEEKLSDLRSKIEAIVILWRKLAEVKQVILTVFCSMLPMQWSYNTN